MRTSWFLVYFAIALLVLSPLESTATSLKIKERKAASLGSTSSKDFIEKPVKLSKSSTSLQVSQAGITSPTCDDSCSTCSGTTANDCLTCPANFMFVAQTCTSYTGYIQVMTSDGSFLGYVNTQYTEPGYPGITATESQALLISFATTGSPFNLQELNGDAEATTPYLGFFVDPTNSDNNLNSGSANYAPLSDTSGTPPNASAQSGQDTANGNDYIESAVWSFDATTSQLVPQWINTDSSTPPTVLLYIDDDNSFAITGDEAAFNENTGFTTVQVNFFLAQVSQVCSGSCPSCNPNFFLYQEKCLATCPKGYYGDVPSGTCLQCYQAANGASLLTCATCNAAGNSSCLSCNSGSFLYKGECLAVCPAGYFGDVTTNTCDQCYQAANGATFLTCATCNAAGNSSCLSCSSGSFLYGGECLAACPAGYFGNTKTNTCTQCYQTQSGFSALSCATCSAAGNSSCLTCSSGSFMYQGECLATCPAGYFGNTKTSTCTQCYQSSTTCPYTCATCNAAGNSSCLSCNSGSFLYQGQCVLQCPIGSYKNKNTNACTKCPQTMTSSFICMSCTSSSSSACTIYGTNSLLASIQSLYPLQVCSKTSNNPYQTF